MPPFQVPEKTKSPRQNIDDSVKDELIRGATLIHDYSRALSEILAYPRQVTHAFALQNTLLIAFDCTLSGPFDDLFSAGFSASPALCGIMITFISASTVWFIFWILTFVLYLVNRRFFISSYGSVSVYRDSRIR